MITIGFSTKVDNPSYIKELQSKSLFENEIIQIINNNEYSLTEAYNKILAKSKNDIVLLIHDDIILPKHFDKIFFDKFNDSDYGVLGLAGTINMPENGMWWSDRTKMVGRVHHQYTTNDGKIKISESKYSGKFKDIIETCLIDGLFIGVHKSRIKSNFDEKYKGFHFYDISFSFKQHSLGVKVGVVTDMKIIHKSVGQIYDSKGNINKNWEDNRNIFLEEFKDKLPLTLKPNIFFNSNKIKESNKSCSIISIVENLDKYEKCLDSIIEHSSDNNIDIIIGVKDFHIYETLNELSLSLKSEFNIEMQVILLDFIHYSNNINELIKYSNSEFICIVAENLEFLNDNIAHFIKSFNSKTGLLSGRIHNSDNNLIYHNGYKLFVKKDKKTNNNVMLISHDNINTPYSYIEHTKNDTIAVNKILLFTKKDLFNKIKFDINLLNYYQGLKMGINMLKYNKKNYVITDAVSLYDHVEEDVDVINKDYSENIIPFINTRLKKIHTYISKI